MPNYDYKCKECAEQFVSFTFYDDRDKTVECPECGKVAGERFYGKMPGLTKASYIDGTNRFGDLKVTAKLEQIKAQAKFGSDLREQVSKELNEREKKNKK